MDTKKSELDSIELAQKVRKACIASAREGFQDALMRGLCTEGAIEAAISDIQSLDLEKIIAEGVERQ